MARNKEMKIAIKIAGRVDASLKNALSQVSKSLGSVTRTAARVTKSVATAAVSATAVIGKAAVDVGKEFESSMSQVSATMLLDKSTAKGQKDFKALEEAARECGRTTAFSAAEAAEGLNNLAMAGYDAANAATALPTVLNLAGAGGLELAESAKIITAGMASLGIEKTEAEFNHFADVIAITASKAKTDVAQMGEAITTVGGTAKGLKGGTAEIAASLGILADADIVAAEGGTHLRNLIVSLQNPRNKDAAAMFDRLGMSAYTSEGKMRGLNEVFSDLNQAMAGWTDQEKNDALTKIFKQTDLAAANALISNCGERFDELYEAARNSSSGVGAAAQMYARQMDNLEGDIAIFKSGMSDLGISIYKDVNTPLRDAVQLGSKMADTLSQGYDAGGISGMAAAVGVCLSQAVQAAAEFSPKMVSAGTGLVQNLVSGVAANAGTLASAASQTIGAFVDGAATILPETALAAADIVAQLAQGAAAQLPQMAASGTQAITSFASGIAQRIPEITNTALALIQTVTDSLMDNGPQLFAAAGMIVASLRSGIMQALPALAQMGVEVLNSLASGIGNGLPQMIPAAMDALVQFSGSLRTNVGLLVDAGLNLVMVLAQSLIANIPVFIRTIPAIITNLCGIINDNAPKLVTTGLQLLAQMAVGLVQAIPVFVENIPQIIQAAVAVFQAFNWANLGRSAITAIRDGVKSLSATLPAAFKNICGRAKDAIKGVNWGAVGTGVIRSLVAGVKALAAAVPKALKAIGKTAWEWMKNVNWKDLGIQVIKGIISGITSMGKGAWKAIKGIFTGKEDKVDMSGTGKEAVQSYAGAVASSAPEVAKAANRVSENAFQGAASTSAQAAGNRAGKSFASAVDSGIRTARVDASKAVDKPSTDKNLRAAGQKSAKAARNGLQAGINASKVNLGKVKVDAKSFDSSMKAAGQKGASSFSKEVKKGAEKATKATAQLGKDINSQMDNAWKRVQANAGTAMNALVNTLAQSAQNAVHTIRAAFEDIAIRIPAPKIPEIQVTKTTVSYGSGRNRESVEVPKFSTVWHAVGGIFRKPTIFGTASGNHGVGEAGAEAILPLDLLWAKMHEILDSPEPSIIDTLLDELSSIGGSVNGRNLQQAQPSMASAGADGIFKIEYSPTYNLYGSASKQEVAQADKRNQKEFQKEFAKAMKQWEKEQKRRKFKRK